VKQVTQQRALRTKRVILVTTFSVTPQSPLLVAKGASTWNTRKVPVGSTFDNWVRRSDDTFLPPEATELELKLVDVTTAAIDILKDNCNLQQ
jgi:hypothetical protein